MHKQLEKIFTDRVSPGERRAFLEEEIKAHPWFGLPYFFLAKELPLEDAAYTEIAAKAALHFAHPYLMQYKLQHAGDIKNPPAENLVSSLNSEHTPAPPPGSNVASPETKDLGELVFEPLYTTDYFASQGIKLSEQALATDKLGKQMKSFTEWLKSMKKLPGSQLPVTAGVDGKVQQMAEKSNQETEILTESMAEVFIEQHKPDRAIEIYEKLSLLNPAKSAYFAAKIDALQHKG